MDIDGLTRAAATASSPGRVNVVVRDTTEPSVLAHEILNGQPFTFLDDAPLEERRSRAVPLRRGLPVEAHELGRLDPAAIERVAAQVRPDPRDADELHDLLMTVLAHRPQPDWQAMVRRADRRPPRAVSRSSAGRGAVVRGGTPPRRRGAVPGRRRRARPPVPGPGRRRPTRTRPRPTCSAATWTAAARPPSPTLAEATGLPEPDR